MGAEMFAGFSNRFANIADPERSFNNKTIARRIPGVKSVKKVLVQAGLVLAWSSGFIGARMINGGESVYLVLFWRFAIAAVIFSPWLGLTLIRGVALRDVANQSCLGFLAMFCSTTFAVKAVATGLPPGTAALISALQPLATTICAVPVLGERISARKWLGSLIALAGVALATGGPTGHAPLSAYGLAVAASLCLVLATLISKLSSTSMSIFPALAVQSAVSALCMLPLAVLDGRLAPHMTAQFATVVLWFVIISTAVGYGLYWFCLRENAASEVATLIYLTPVITAAWAYVVFGEPTTMKATLGYFVCVIGIAIGTSAFTTKLNLSKK
ncbi:DMT family transporter [Bradyrhizobium sp. NBAIM03]|uniref:DMT family transporter n=1 Tax=Bradyrhizobium sp. NBAIM03 TaxID=2793816 RepID=UPI001CD5FE25|nr:DMT family transporter [Bradyrhizobium sp. NBAIM03]MCA1536119.1 DMT family transporter [Bradyrhizobium sp. NBAIM03]